MRRTITLIALLLCSGQVALVQETPDPYIWLEDVESAAAVEWASVRTKRTLEQLTRAPVYESIRADVLKYRSGPNLIPDLSIRGQYIDHVLRAPDQPRGLWRRTTVSSYLAGDPRWQSLLDADALARAENVNWIVNGTFCLSPEMRHCMVRLSRGGSDAHVLREFDAARREFVTGGFSIPEERLHQMRWIDADTVLVGTDFGADRGVPRTIRRWRRGTPLAEASVVFQSALPRGSVSTRAMGGLDFIIEMAPTRERTIYLHRGDRTVPLDLPKLRDLPRALGPSIGVVQGQLVFQPFADWNVGGRIYPAGAVLAIDLEAFVAGKRELTVVVAPDERTVIYELRMHRSGVVVELLRNVRSELHEYRFGDGRWSGARLPAPELGVAELLAADPSGLFLFRYESFLQPPTLYARLDNGKVQRLFAAPEGCDTSDLMVEQLEATSRDGTRVPYFVIRPRTLTFDGSHPTLLFGYGGYGIAQLPRYAPPMLCAWGKRGGVHVVSNIRGGGEFGPAWHRAGMLESRQNAFDDFFAVAEDLVRRKITSPQRLAIRGASNGGTLMGVAINQRPDLFGAVVATVPVFDLKRNAQMGGNPIDSDLGNPDNPAHWAFLSKYSPYHNVSSAKYPPMLIVSNRRDDRAPVGHARKMAARLEEMGHEVLYHELAGGGHGGETADQAAGEIALGLTFLLQRLHPAYASAALR